MKHRSRRRPQTGPRLLRHQPVPKAPGPDWWRHYSRLGKPPGTQTLPKKCNPCAWKKLLPMRLNVHGVREDFEGDVAN